MLAAYTGTGVKQSVVGAAVTRFLGPLNATSSMRAVTSQSVGVSAQARHTKCRAKGHSQGQGCAAPCPLRRTHRGEEGEERGDHPPPPGRGFVGNYTRHGKETTRQRSFLTPPVCFRPYQGRPRKDSSGRQRVSPGQGHGGGWPAIPGRESTLAAHSLLHGNNPKAAQPCSARPLPAARTTATPSCRRRDSAALCVVPLTAPPPSTNFTDQTHITTSVLLSVRSLRAAHVTVPVSADSTFTLHHTGCWCRADPPPPGCEANTRDSTGQPGHGALRLEHRAASTRGDAKPGGSRTLAKDSCIISSAHPAASSRRATHAATPPPKH
ncbi:hypothetical protein O3P69_002902 [Scylla paramamosain]|uniref:Uncharacterized protein n=1 Tax=Scylla paramamosain TaxID=85552 RepID=A0AAW0UR32_SCYPA